MEQITANSMHFYNWKNQHDHFREDVIQGLSGAIKSIPPKYFYDERGSQLFDKICETKEYYPTRTESQILSDHAGDIMRALPEHISLIELGSGSSIKTRYLLEEGQDDKIRAYVPIDISEEHLLNSTARLSEMFDSISMIPICADYTCMEKLPSEKLLNSGEPVIFFPGSTIGNLEREAAGELLDTVFRLIHGSGYFLVGFDLIKDRQTLEAAYNDEEGYTAAFNLNLLERMNRELGADFDLSAFRHHAFYNEEKKRMEMHLVSTKDQIAELDGKRFSFKAGESIHTECSHKYDLKDFETFAAAHGFAQVSHWTDENKRFAVALFKTNRYPLLH
ncbi:MAG: L-histidine N(alpha)-methyltransferase [Proteobacteria bacterium]|nr:MAG: L-histidine N(alpha)-methyltransferase [Pseudomonadota bacterium]